MILNPREHGVNWMRVGRAEHRFGTEQRFCGRFLAVDDVISGFGGHEDFDASLGTVDAVSMGAPE